MRVTIVQHDIKWEDKIANLTKISNLIEPLQGKADIILLPEMFSTGFVTNPEYVAEKPNGETFKWLQAMSKFLNCAIVSSIIINENEKFYNRLIWMNPEGNYNIYDKRHLFRMGGEHEKFSFGTSDIIVNYKGWKVKPLICYDLRFPVWSRNRYKGNNYDYDLLIYVANWPAARKTAWLSLLQARAIENQSYCIGVNRIGNDNNSNLYVGNSIAFDFLGNNLTNIAENSEVLETVELNKSALTSYREKFKVSLDWDTFSIDTHSHSDKYLE